MVIDKEKCSPMMQKYLETKEKYPDTILFYRLGDFYEMFFDDAILVSRELEITLTGKDCGLEKRAPMAGVPFHAAENYIAKLVAKGYKVAICEQLEDPSNAKGLVDRGIVKIVTPGTYMDSTMDAKTTNYMASCDISSFEITVVYCELSTGELKYQTLQRSLVALQKALLEQNVSELVCPMAMDKKWMSALEEMETILISKHKKSSVDSQDLPLLNGIESESLKEAFALLMAYLKDTQKQHIDHFLPIESMDKDKVLVMDYETKNHLELVSSQSTNAKAESLWSFMDKCQSAMGSRLLKRWIEYPLIDAKKIAKRQAAIKDLKENFMLRENLKEHLVYVYDIERLASRMAYGSASPRDVLQLVATLEHAKPILDLAISLDSYPEFSQVPDCQELYNEIKNAIVENPPLTLKEGGVFNDGYNQELDEVRRIAKKGKDFILELEAKERERTGVKSLKVGYNRIFGYFIEVRNGNLSNIKDEFGYHAKQTLANATRFVTQELKEKEEQILHAQETKVKLEQSLFNDLLLRIKKDLFDLHACAQALSTIDVLVSLAILASEKGYVCPVFHPGYNVNVVEGKHPILDDRMKKKRYVSNDWKMSEDEHVQLITGPNMGGKSTYMRQNALLVVMAQMGSFIPAKTAELPIFDRIFTRIGASDDILTGKSTFMVEMMEANAALCYATKHSLILFDEIGRGTATYDGMALAQAMLEYIDEAIGAKTLFSTHYHELTDLEKEHPSMHNVHVDVREEKNEIEFRYRIIDGKADKSYGINVARLAHLPKVVLDRAAQLLTNFENQDNNQNYQPSLFVMEQVQPEKSKLLQQLQELDIDSMTPRDALDCLYELKKLSEKIEL